MESSAWFYLQLKILRKTRKLATFSNLNGGRNCKTRRSVFHNIDIGDHWLFGGLLARLSLASKLYSISSSKSRSKRRWTKKLQLSMHFWDTVICIIKEPVILLTFWMVYKIINLNCYFRQVDPFSVISSTSLLEKWINLQPFADFYWPITNVFN